MKKYRNTIEFEVYGPYALFSDPVMRVGGEKTSYHIPTYEALRGIVEIRFRQKQKVSARLHIMVAMSLHTIRI